MGLIHSFLSLDSSMQIGMLVIAALFIALSLGAVFGVERDDRMLRVGCTVIVAAIATMFLYGLYYGAGIGSLAADNVLKAISWGTLLMLLLGHASRFVRCRR